MFNPEEFLNQTVTDSNDTTFTNPPDNMNGDGYLILCDKVEIFSSTAKDDESKTFVILNVMWDIQDETVKTFCGRDKVICKQGLFLDFTDSGQLDMGKGKNIQLGKLRDALGMNNPGEPFSFNMMVGRLAKGFVQHVPDKKDVSVIRAEIKKVLAA